MHICKYLLRYLELSVYLDFGNHTQYLLFRKSIGRGRQKYVVTWQSSKYFFLSYIGYCLKESCDYLHIFDDEV